MGVPIIVDAASRARWTEGFPVRSYEILHGHRFPEKVAIALRNLDDAGLAHLAGIRQGYARETLRHLGGPADFVEGYSEARGIALAIGLLNY